MNKGIRTQIQSRAQRIGKGIMPAVQTFGKTVPARIGRFRRRLKIKIPADTVNRRVVKQIAQQFRNNPPAGRQPSAVIIRLPLIRTNQIIGIMIKRPDVPASDDVFPSLSSVMTEIFPVLPALQKATGNTPLFRKSPAMCKLCTGASGAPSPPAIMSSERKSQMTGMPVRSAKSPALPT